MPLSPDILAGWVPDGVIRLNTGSDGLVHQPEKGPGINSIPNAYQRMDYYNVQPPSPQELIAQAVKKIRDTGIPMNQVKCCVTKSPTGRIVAVQFLHEGIPQEDAFLSF
jgi:hypothetical protein